MNSYEKIYNLIVERSALPRIEKYDGDEYVEKGSDDPEEVYDIKRRRRELAKHLKDIKAGKKEPSQKLAPDERKENEYGEVESHPERKGPGGEGGGRTHAQAAGDLESDTMEYRGGEADDTRSKWERRVAAREKQAEKVGRRRRA